MDTFTLCKLACGDNEIKKKFGGVFAADTLPKNRGIFSKFIVNLDGKRLSGSHWCAIIFKQNKAIFIDSYGLPPTVKTILQFMKRNSKEIFYNPICYQDDMSTTCGIFSLYFLYKMSRNVSFVELRVFDTLHNEKFIRKFVKKLKFSSCCFRHSKTFQSCVALANSHFRHHK